MTTKRPVTRLAYSAEEAAVALSISIETVRRAISHDLIRHTRLGRSVRIPALEVERLSVEGVPPIPQGYKRKATGPTKRGRPPKAKPARSLPATKKREAERRAGT